MAKITLLELAKRNPMYCPNDGGTIGDHIVKMTAWCPKCQRIYRIRRNENTWKVNWSYVK